MTAADTGTEALRLASERPYGLIGTAAPGDRQRARQPPAHTPEGSTAILTATGDGTHVAVEVSDDGAGVPADQLPRIFYRFYRAGLTSRRPGSGLGLAIAAAVAAALGEPHGLRITLILPAGSPHASRATDDADGQAGAAAEETTSLARTCRVARTDQDIPEDRHVIQALAAKEIPSPAAR